MGFNNDLALEARELASANTGRIEGVSNIQRKVGDFSVTEITIENEKGSRTLEKPCGKYITVEMPEEVQESMAISVISQELLRILPKKCGRVLVIGLGNENVTPDALGPEAVKSIVVTRHLKEDLEEIFERNAVSTVSALAPGVMGQTGIESAEIIKSLINCIKPDTVITVDALCARRLSRLARTVQITDTGIKPGSGIGNTRAELSKTTLGIPVIAMGMPTVVSATTLTADIMTVLSGEEGKRDEIYKAVEEKMGLSLFVTPKEIDSVVSDCARIMAMAINTALHRGFTNEEMEQMLI